MAELAELVKTVNFASIKHKDQRRKDEEQTPYINHPVGVAQILIDAGITDLNVLQAAILHDTVEDTDTTYEELVQTFNKRVADLVMEVTDDKTLPKQRRKDLQVEKAPFKSKEAKMVKMADKLYNLRDLKRSRPIGWTDERVKEYFEWASKVVDGCRGQNENLENELDKIL